MIAGIGVLDGCTAEVLHAQSRFSSFLCKCHVEGGSLQANNALWTLLGPATVSLGPSRMQKDGQTAAPAWCLGVYGLG